MRLSSKNTQHFRETMKEFRAMQQVIKPNTQN